MKKNCMVDKISILVIVGFLVLLCSSALAKVIHQGHPPVNLPMPPPPENMTKKDSFNKWSSADIIREFQERGLEVTVTKGLALGSPSAKESTIFLMPSFGEDIGSLVSSFDSERAMDEAVMYYSRMNSNSDTPAWRIFRKDNILVLISGKVPEEQAAKYEDVLNNLEK